MNQAEMQPYKLDAWSHENWEKRYIKFSLSGPDQTK